MRVSSALNRVFRQVILRRATNGAVRQVVSCHGMQFGAKRFVAGETLDEAIVSLHRLERNGLKTNTSILGEQLEDESAAIHVTDEYIRVLDPAEEFRIGRDKP